MSRGLLSALLFGVLAFALADSRVRAEPLDAATCGQLKGEQVRMEQTGVRGNMEKGPAWAKSNLAADKLEQIRRLMDLDEQLLFRCSSRNLVELPPDADGDPAPTPAKADDEGKDPASSKTDAAPASQKKPGTAKAAPAEQAKTPAAKPKPKEAAKTAPTTPKAPAKDTGATSSSDKAAAATKTKAKSKADDAYKPPPVNPAVDPFANAPARQ